MARKTQADPAPTMVDVARAAGVSQSCVSLVLNDTPGARLSQSTREKVRKTAATLGYRLPERRGQRRTPSSDNARNVVALIVDEVSISPHAVLHIDGARDAAWSADCLLEIYVTRGHEGLEGEAAARIAAEPAVLGAIYATSFTRRVDLPDRLGAHPTVLVNCYDPGRSFPSLLPGEVAGGFAATQHLLSHGHRRIGAIGGEGWMDAAKDRLKGYREALATADIGIDADLVREGNWSAASGYDRTIELMRLGSPPTALFCSNDMMALGAMQALSDLGLSVPEDVSIVGYNDVELARHLRPALTTCRVPSYEMGRRAAEMILDMALRGRSYRPMTTKLECPLIARSSVALHRDLRRSGQMPAQLVEEG